MGKKIILKLVGILIGFLVSFLVFSFVAPKTIKVKRDITINAPKTEVYNFVKSLKNTSEHSVWQQKDPNTVKTFTGEDGVVGSKYRWESEHKEVGVGEQEILSLVPNKEVKTALRFEKPWEMDDVASFFIEDAENGQTKLVWDYESEKIPVPFNAFVFLQGVQKDLVKDFDAGLVNFKKVIEQ